MVVGDKLIAISLGDTMRILHIANIKENKANGVCVAVPQHVISQANFADVAFININNVAIPELKEYQIFVDNNTKIEKKLDKFGLPDIVVFHEVNYIDYIYIYKQFLKRNIPYVILPHGSLTQGALRKKWLKKKVAYTLLFNKFIRNALAIQCLSQSEADRIKIKTPQKFIGTNGIYDIPNKKQNHSEKCTKLLYIGRLDIIIKGLDRLFDAIYINKEYFELNNITLDIYGPNKIDQKVNLQEFVNKKSLTDIVILHEPVYGEEKYEILRNHDLFVQVSRTEGMPVGILEAMNIGLPCFITQGTSMLDMLIKYDAGYCAGETSEDMATNLIKAIECNQKKAKGCNAIRLVSENYLWNNVSCNNIKKYKQLVEQNESNI